MPEEEPTPPPDPAYLERLRLFNKPYTPPSAEVLGKQIAQFLEKNSTVPPDSEKNKYEPIDLEKLRAAAEQKAKAELTEKVLLRATAPKSPQATPPMESNPRPEHPQGPFHLFQQEWPKVIQVWRSFLVCVALVGGLLCWGAFWLSQKLNEATITAQAAHLSAQDGEIAQLSLRPESIPEQEQEIKALRAKVASFEADNAARSAKEWPALAAEQIASLGKALSQFKIPDFLVLVYGSNAEKFGESVQQAAQQIKGCSAFMQMDYLQKFGNYSVRDKYGDNKGITILADKDYPCAPVLLDFLTSAGYQARWDKGSSVKTAVIMFIGERP